MKNIKIKVPIIVIILVKNCEEVDWKELGHSFISGLTQSKYVKSEEVKNNE